MEERYCHCYCHWHCYCHSYCTAGQLNLAHTCWDKKELRYIYIIGGTAGNPGVPEKPELVTPGHEIYAYNPMTKALKLEGYMEVPVAYADSIVVNGKIYVIGGWWHGKSVRDSVLEFNPLAAPPAHQTRDVDAKGKQTSIWGTLKTTE